MSRIRTVKPEYFTSLPVARLSMTARLAFIGLWTHVDDAGRCVDEPRLVKAALFPLDDDLTIDVVDALLDELAAGGRIVRYEVDGARLIEVIGWAEHQRIDKAKQSKFPPRPGTIDPSPNDPRRVVDASTNDPGRVVDASRLDRTGPDRTGSGKDRTDDRARTPAHATHDHGPRAESSVVEEIIELAAAGIGAKAGKTGHRGYMQTVRHNVATERTDEIAAALAAGRTPDEIAAEIAGGSTWVEIGAGTKGAA